MKWVQVHACTCTTREHQDVPRLCPQGEEYHVEVPTDPDYTVVRRPSRSDSTGRGRGAELPPPEEGGRRLRPEDLPRRMQGIRKDMEATGSPVVSMYSRGWARRTLLLNPDASAAAERTPVTVRVEAISLRSRYGVALWLRRELTPGSGAVYPCDQGWETWQTPEAWALDPDNRVQRVKITELRRRLGNLSLRQQLERLEKGDDDVAHTEPAP